MKKKNKELKIEIKKNDSMPLEEIAKMADGFTEEEIKSL